MSSLHSVHVLVIVNTCDTIVKSDFENGRADKSTNCTITLAKCSTTFLFGPTEI